MKSLRKLLIVDVVLLVATVLLGKVPIVCTILVTLTAILGTYTVLEGVRIKKEADEIASIPVEVQRRSLIEEKLEKLSVNPAPAVSAPVQAPVPAPMPESEPKPEPKPEETDAIYSSKSILNHSYKVPQ